MTRRKLTSQPTGFSLIELLAAMAILMALVAMMALVFSDSDRAWVFGVERSESNAAGRAALAMIAHDLQYAVADDLISFVQRRDRYGLKSYGFTNSEICFASIQHDSSDKPASRSVREIFYWIRRRKTTESTGQSYARYELVRGYYGPDITDTSGDSPDYLEHCYWEAGWFENPSQGGKGRPSYNAVMAQNISGLAFMTPWDVPDASGHKCYYSVDSPVGDKLPPYIDVFLEVLDTRIAIEVARMADMGLPEEQIHAKVEKSAHRYCARVNFYNRTGYHPRHQDPDKYPEMGPTIP
jgi:type II secretory pathway pseudopilin PulG